MRETMDARVPDGLGASETEVSSIQLPSESHPQWYKTAWAMPGVRVEWVKW